jgi:hypothetical protein
MLMKCVGGYHDGQQIEVNVIKIGHWIRLMIPRKFALKSFKETLDQIRENINKPIEIKYEYYIVSALHCNWINDEVKNLYYLHPTSMHPFEAIQHQFNK